jgi:Skp family chaperone for outer membrane proteins
MNTGRCSYVAKPNWRLSFLSHRFLREDFVVRSSTFGLGIIAVITMALYLTPASTSHSAEETSDSKTAYHPPENLRIATLDAASIWKRSEKLKSAMVKLKKKVDAAEERIKEQQKQIADMQPQPQHPTPQESPVNDHVEQLANLLKEAVKTAKEEFMQEEGKIYIELSERIDQEVERCAKRHGVQMVFRINREPINPNDRNDILRSINKPIAFSDPQLDITDEVLSALDSDESN